jgi:hypothetical protein
MKNLTKTFFLGLLISTLLSSCAVVGGIFKAGVWVGILIVVVIIIIIIAAIAKMGGGK